VQPNGTVIVPFQGGGIDVFSSTNGGASWGRSQQIALIDSHLDAAGIRNPDLPSAAIDGAGNVYVVWADCRFRQNCAENDIVMSTSADGKNWSAVTRIPIDPTASTVDHFIPGIGADPATSGANAHLAIVYYYYSNTNCTISTCQLYAGFTTSTDGGATWTAGTKLGGPMKVGWLPVSDNGPMVADYIGVSYSNGNPYCVIAGALPSSGTTYNEAMYTTKNPLPVRYDAPRFSSINDHPVPNAHSDHPMKFFYDDEGHREIPRSRWVTNAEPQ